MTLSGSHDDVTTSQHKDLHQWSEQLWFAEIPVKTQVLILVAPDSISDQKKFATDLGVPCHSPDTWDQWQSVALIQAGFGVCQAQKRHPGFIGGDSPGETALIGDVCFRPGGNRQGLALF